MKTKTRFNILSIVSLIVILSLLIASCAPGQSLSGAAGADATEAPVEEPPVEEPPAEEPPVEEPPVEEPPVVEAPPTEPPVVEEPPTEPPVVEEPPTEEPVVDISTPTNTPTFTPTPTATKTAGAQNSLAGGIAPPTSTYTPTPTNTATFTATPTNTSTPTPTQTWDKSSVSVNGVCNKSTGQVEFTITNGGSAMTGSTSWSVSAPGVSISPASGSFSLGAGESIVVAFGPYWDTKVSIVVNQRVGHPGTSVAKADATCAKPASTPTPTNTATSTVTPTNTPAQTNTPTSTPTTTPTPLPDPYLGLGVACNKDLSATFTIKNIGGPMTGGTYTISEPGKALQTVAFDLGAGKNISFNTAGNATVTVKYATSELDQVNLGATGTCLPLPTNTPTQTSTPTKTFTPTKTATVTNTVGPSPTPTSTRTPTSTKTLTPTKTSTSTITPGPSPTPTFTKTLTPTKTSTSTITPGPSPTPTFTKTFTPTKTPKPTKTFTPTKTPTPTNTDGPSPTPTFTRTLTPTKTATFTPTITLTPTITFTPTVTFTPTLTPTVEILDGQLDLNVFCNTDLSATFVISNISGAVSNGSYSLSDPAESGAINLPSGGSMSIDGKGYATMTVTYRTSFLSSVTLSVVGSCSKHPTATPTNTPTITPTITATFTPTPTPTNTPVSPKLTATGACTSDTAEATFTITNNGGDMPAAYTYNIKDSTGSVVKSGTFQLNGGGSVSVTVNGNYGVLTLSITDNKGTTTDAATTTCVKPPKLTAIGSCTDDTALATFVITNSGGDMQAAYTYNIKDSTGSVVKSGTFQLKAGGSETVTASGNYGVLTLSITDSKGTATDAATTTCIKLQKLTAVGSCTSDTAEATFIITNSGGDMPKAYTYEVKDSTGSVVKSGTFQLKAGGSVSITTSGNYGVLTLSITDDKGTTTDAATTTCVKPPKLTAVGSCTNDTAEATFIITNSGGDMPTQYTYEVKDSTSYMIMSGKFQLKAGGTETVTINGTYGVLTLSITDDKGTTTDAATTTCVKPPKLTAVGSCTDDTALATFVITNSGGDMPAAYTYNIKDSSGKVSKSGTFQLKAGDVETVTASGNYGVLTLSITDNKGTTTDAATTTCVKPPKLTALGNCTDDTALATFVITNSGGDMPAAYTYNIKDSAGSVVKSGAFQLKTGENISVTASGNYGVLTLSITDDKGTTTDAATTTCVKPPKLTAIGACTDDSTATATFVITNSGGDMPAAYTYNIKDSAGSVVKSGTFQLKAGGSISITTSGTLGILTLSITDDKGTTADAAMTNCKGGPGGKLAAIGACTDDTALATFIITNSGSDMPKSYTYDIKDSAGKMVKTDTFKLKAGESLTVSASGNYGILTLSITDDKGTTTDAATTTCKKLPKLAAIGACVDNTALATFTITNNGGDMPKAYSYNIKDSAGKVVKTGSFQLKAGENVSVSASGNYGILTLSITDEKSITIDVATTTCKKSPKLTATGACVNNTTDAKFVITNSGGDMPKAYTYTIKNNAGKVVKTDTFQLKAGESISITIKTSSGVTLTLSITDDKGTTASAATTTCKKTEKKPTPIPGVAAAKAEPCIQCLVFHTFRDENLEIYRLDGIEGQPGFKLYNLSKDVAVDSRPSRAPDDSGIVFQSNRDGNVELYTTDLLGSGNAARLTNTQSNNTTPMYGPDAKTVVFQSDRNGNMDLFTIDENTRKERQITSDPADDVNPFYSPDLKWLVFQSNRNNNWDAFILNTETGNEYQLTSTPANETFPAWSPNGKQIAFIMEENGNTDLYIIDVKGTNLKRITTDGKTVNAVWSPEGNRIAYQSERNGNLDIYSFDLKDNKEYRVTDYAGQDSGPTWDCGGTNLAFTSIRNGDPNVFQVFWKGGPAGNMTIDPATDKWSQWRPSNDVSSTGY